MDAIERSNVTSPLDFAAREDRQGGDLRSYAEGAVRLDLSICSNTMGPPPSAVAALREFATRRPRELVPPPYEAGQQYIQAYAAYVGAQEPDLLCGRGVTEFLVVLSRVLAGRDVALVPPEYTETLNRFAYATHYGPADAAHDTAAARLRRVEHAMANHRYVLLSNPNNPLGIHHSRQELLEVCRAHPQSTLIVDEEYVHLGPRGVSLVGADLDNVLVLQSSGKTFGLTGTRAGVLWTHNLPLRQTVAEHLPTWPLSLLDAVVTTAALSDTGWSGTTLPYVRGFARRLEELLVSRFDSVVAADIHYRFIHLTDPEPTVRHLEKHGIAVRAFDGRIRGRASGIRLMTPVTEMDFDLLDRALRDLPEHR
ncbi:aminotransferase class I/II-fold pyridoxal phosphate-dependent enzyme [Streptomyces sp. CAU 1734]|uniref:aminotransferase class I/II-fold pyridoxal phosphate-dependent enzyme n=1 Tax=Streptomyces sp. CAU 1734 TaxID=3140360 RepID=UPI0032602125